MLVADLNMNLFCLFIIVIIIKTQEELKDMAKRLVDTKRKLLIDTKSYNLCLGKFYIIRSQEENSNQNREVSSLVVNIMTDSVMTAPPGKSGIRLKREI